MSKWAFWMAIFPILNGEQRVATGWGLSTCQFYFLPWDEIHHHFSPPFGGKSFASLFPVASWTYAYPSIRESKNTIPMHGNSSSDLPRINALLGLVVFEWWSEDGWNGPLACFFSSFALAFDWSKGKQCGGPNESLMENQTARGGLLVGRLGYSLAFDIAGLLRRA